MNTVDHQINKNRFVIAKENHECILDYTLVEHSERSVIDFTHTYVPFALRGQKLADQLVEAGLVWAKKQGYQIKASCSYVQKFL
jgi:predicted GNAT family acetyltransferase